MRHLQSQHMVIMEHIHLQRILLQRILRCGHMQHLQDTTTHTDRRLLAPMDHRQVDLMIRTDCHLRMLGFIILTVNLHLRGAIHRPLAIHHLVVNRPLAIHHLVANHHPMANWLSRRHLVSSLHLQASLRQAGWGHQRPQARLGEHRRRLSHHHHRLLGRQVPSSATPVDGDV